MCSVGLCFSPMVLWYSTVPVVVVAGGGGRCCGRLSYRNGTGHASIVAQHSGALAHG